MAQFFLSALARQPSELSQFRAGAFRTAALISAIALVTPVMAVAQTSGADAGSALWGAFRAVLYGPWGLVGSAGLCGGGFFIFFVRGALPPARARGGRRPPFLLPTPRYL